MSTETKLKILKGRIILKLNGGRAVEVKPFTKTHLIKHMGYYDKIKAASGEDPYVYIYRGKLRKNEIKVPGSIYKVNNGAKGEKMLWVAHEEDKKQKYHLSECIEMNSEIIASQLNDPNLKIKQITPELMESVEGEVFVPQIRENDDILKRIIKTVLQNMRINLKSLKHKFGNDYDLNNLKSQLIKEGSMSSKYFTRWAEILDINIELVVRNKPGFNRLKDDEITVLMK